MRAKNIPPQISGTINQKYPLCSPPFRGDTGSLCKAGIASSTEEEDTGDVNAEPQPQN